MFNIFNQLLFRRLSPFTMTIVLWDYLKFETNESLKFKIFRRAYFSSYKQWNQSTPIYTNTCLNIKFILSACFRGQTLFQFWNANFCVMNTATFKSNTKIFILILYCLAENMLKLKNEM